MTDELPEYIEHRIRRSIPSDACVVPGSTPVVSFGNARVATVATLGLNPSRVEFLDHHGNMLTGKDRRLATHESLRTGCLLHATSDVAVQVLLDCDNYFCRNPYRRWFDQLEIVLSECGASYYDGTACHLDLVQWATDPTWGKLDSKVRNRLLDADASFLNEQLSRENIEILLVNGTGVRDRLTRSLDVTFNEQDPIVGFGHHDTRLFTATMPGGQFVVAWSTNLQSSHGVSTDLRMEIAAQVEELITRNGPPSRTSQITQERCDELLAFLRVFDSSADSSLRPNWLPDDSALGESGELTMPHPEYPPIVEEFFELAAQPCWSDYDYDPQAAAKMVLSDDAVAAASLEQIKTLLTFCVRGERFCDGHWESMIINGRVGAILRRLNELRNAGK